MDSDTSSTTTTTTSAECPRKSMKRKPRTRRVSKDCAFDMAEARREVVHALHLHRSSSSSSSLSSTYTKRENPILGINDDVGKPNFVVGSQFYSYSLVNTLPAPEPIWSTTAPSILAAPAPVEELEFEWDESESSSWSWWLGFLKTMDENSNGNGVEEEHNVDNVVVEKTGEFSFGQQSDDLGSFPDEWLVVPTKDEEEEADVP